MYLGVEGPADVFVFGVVEGPVNRGHRLAPNYLVGLGGARACVERELDPAAKCTRSEGMRGGGEG